ncbi:hypothetical protein OFC53_24380, partial [Escherichia coli]|nr:hypothetical protein [Escherichia coli]
DKVIAQLDDTAWSSPAWLTHMKTLRHKVLHHLEEEEQRFFQMAGKVMSDKQKQQLANDYIEEMAS